MVTDLFTKHVEFFPLKTQTADESAVKMVEYIGRHSVMEQILSDQGRNFQSESMSELWELLDVRKSRMTSYFPSANGQCERMMRTMQNMLCNYVNERKDNWSDFLPLLQLAYNTAVNTSHGFTPFELQHGRYPKMPLDLLNPRNKIELYFTPSSYARMLQNELPELYALVSKNSDAAVKKRKIRHDRTIRAATFKVGDFVWVLDTAKLKNVSKKLSHRWKGLYKVVGVIDENDFQVKTLNGKKMIVVNKSKLKRCTVRKILQEEANHTLKPTETAEDSETTREEIVDEILKEVPNEKSTSKSVSKKSLKTRRRSAARSPRKNH